MVLENYLSLDRRVIIIEESTQINKHLIKKIDLFSINANDLF